MGVGVAARWVARQSSSRQQGSGLPGLPTFQRTRNPRLGSDLLIFKCRPSKTHVAHAQHIYGLNPAHGRWSVASAHQVRGVSGFQKVKASVHCTQCLPGGSMSALAPELPNTTRIQAHWPPKWPQHCAHLHGASPQNRPLSVPLESLFSEPAPAHKLTPGAP